MDTFSVYVPKLLSKKEQFLSGRRSCKGCGKAAAARIASKALAPTAIAPDQVSESVTGSVLPGRNFAHDTIATDALIENLLDTVEKVNEEAARASQTRHKAVEKAVIGFNRRILEDDFTALTRALKKDQSALYLCFDNEAYIDEMLREAIPKPFILKEDVHPYGEKEVARVIQEKHMPPVVKKSEFDYIATSCPSHPFDLIEKIKKGIAAAGNAFILILTPCPTGWMFPNGQTMRMGKLAVATGYFPLYEIEEGTITITQKVSKREPVQTFLAQQKRFFTLPQQLMPVIQKEIDTFNEELEKAGKLHEIFK